MVPFPRLRVTGWCCMCHDSNMHGVWVCGVYLWPKYFTLWLQEKACSSNCLGSHIPILQSTMVLLQLVVQEFPCLPDVMLESWHIQHHPATLNRGKGTMPAWTLCSTVGLTLSVDVSPSLFTLDIRLSVHCYRFIALIFISSATHLFCGDMYLTWSDYGDVVCSCCTEEEAALLERLQNFAARTILCLCRRYWASSARRELSLSTLSSRHDVHLAGPTLV